MPKESKIQRYNRLINKYINLLSRNTGKQYYLAISNDTMLRGHSSIHKKSFAERKIDSLKNKI